MVRLAAFFKKNLLLRSLSLLLTLASAGFVGTAPAFAKAAPKPIVDASALAVADSHAADAAETILREGGNAVDAAVAMAFTLAVTYPEAGNIGGGGFMTLVVGGKPYFLDYRERAPQRATRAMYLDGKGQVIPQSTLVGYRASGVPGTVAGMWDVQRRFGKLGWKAVLQPAIDYASKGFVVDAQLAQRRDKAAADFRGKTNFDDYFGGMKAGETFRQPELAATLQRIADNGAQEFYQGQTAKLIVEAMRGHGLIDASDLSSYKARWREPIVADWNGYRVVTAPPPSSGGVGLVQLLKMKALLASDFDGVTLNSAKYIHLLAELEKRVFADRAQYLGDPDFVQVPVAQLLDETYLKRRASEVNPDGISDTRAVQPGLSAEVAIPPGSSGSIGSAAPQGGTGRTGETEQTGEKPETTHFSVVDKWGNAVSNTYTINGYFGSGVVVSGAGFLLNNEMDDFVSKPGVPNMFGVVGSDANEIAPGKRPLSSMTPTILTRDGKVALVIGTPGGSRIFTSIFQVINDLYDFHLPLADAVASTRVHHQLLPPNTLFTEPYGELDDSVKSALRQMGYTFQQQTFSGDVQAVRVLDGHAEAMADPRGRGVTLTIR